MADEHLLAVLESGAAEWNRWRAATPDSRPDLSSAVLADADLRGFNLAGVNLSRAILRNVRLESTDLSQADFSFADLQGAQLTGAVVDQASFIGANLIGANVEGVDFSAAKITGAKYDQSELRDASGQSDPLGITKEDLHTVATENPGPWLPSTARVYPPNTFYGDGKAAEILMAVDTGESRSADFNVVVDGELTPEQVQLALTALADYYRACGGVGLEIQFRLEEAEVGEVARAR